MDRVDPGEFWMLLNIPNRKPPLRGFAALKASRNSDPSAILIGVVKKTGVIDILQADIKKRHPNAIMEGLF